MSAGDIHYLQKENWDKALAHQRVAGLQELENQAAISERRTAAKVVTFSDQPANGWYDSETNTIGVNISLVNDEIDNSPYQAVETLFHESRHAYQNSTINNPQAGEDPETVNNWKLNNEPGVYTPIEKDPELYSMQPLELDARQAARLKTDEFFKSQSIPQEGYAAYAEGKNAENQERVDNAKRAWTTESPEQVAIEKLSSRHAQIKGSQITQNQDIGEGEISQTIETPSSKENTATEAVKSGQKLPEQTSVHSNGEDYDYGIGY